MRALTRKLVAAALCLAALSPHVRAQGKVWVVDAAGGPGSHFAQIHKAVQVAKDGDTILVRDGNYVAFELGAKALTITAEPGARVSVGRSKENTGIFDLPAGSTAVVRGIEFQASAWSNFIMTYSFMVQDCDGVVWLEDCTFRSGLKATLLLHRSSNVVLQRCTGLDPIIYGTWIELASVVMQGCHFTGGKGAAPIPPFTMSSPGKAGAYLKGSTLVASGCSFTGGVGGDSGGVPCSAAASGGAGLWVGYDEPDVWLAGGRALGGAGGQGSPSCPKPGPVGPRVVVKSGAVTTLGATPMRLISNSPVREGEILELELCAQPGPARTAYLLVSREALSDTAGSLLGVHLLASPTRRVLRRPIDPLTGSATFRLPVGELGPGVETTGLFFQAFVPGAAGGGAGSGAHVVLLDAAF